MTTMVRTDVDLDVLLAHKEELADGVVRLTLRHPGGDPLPEWEPGAHLDLLLGDDLVRQYSLCGDPADRSVLQVAVLREPVAGRAITSGSWPRPGTCSSPVASGSRPSCR